MSSSDSVVIRPRPVVLRLHAGECATLHQVVSLPDSLIEHGGPVRSARRVELHAQGAASAWVQSVKPTSFTNVRLPHHLDFAVRVCMPDSATPRSLELQLCAVVDSMTVACVSDSIVVLKPGQFEGSCRGSGRIGDDSTTTSFAFAVGFRKNQDHPSGNLQVQVRGTSRDSGDAPDRDDVEEHDGRGHGHDGDRDRDRYHLKSTSIENFTEQALTPDGSRHACTFRGRAHVNGHRDWFFEVRAVDNGAKGSADRDRFQIRIFDTSHSLFFEQEGVLKSGNIGTRTHEGDDDSGDDD